MMSYNTDENNMNNMNRANDEANENRISGENKENVNTGANNESREAPIENKPSENKPAGGAYSYTRENLTNTTYNANPYAGASRGGSYGQNPAQSNPYSGYYQNQNQSQPQYGYNGQNPYARPQYTNAYVPQNPNGAQISYNTEKGRKKERRASSVSRGALAVICSLTIVLSGCFGFAGAYLANRTVDTPSAGSTAPAEKTMVVYRSVDDIADSTAVTPGEPLNYSQVVSVVKDSVVEIITEYNVQNMWYNYVTEGAGSGVIVSDNGYIITNNHVICDNSGSKVADNIKVRLTNGEEYTAKVIGHDSDSDIAVIKIEAEGLTFAVAGDSDRLAVGEEVIIVGNPLGKLGGTVTNGIVSATEREIMVDSNTMTLIQTNAAVNPGNSGGGMFNMKGELIGIVNAKSSGSDIEGLGFAIPIKEALRVNEQLLEYGYVRGKTMIGVTFQDISNSNTFMYFYNLKPGVYVYSLEEGYNDKVLQAGDRIIAVNETEVSSSADIKAIVSESAVGDTLKFQLYRDGKLISVDVTCFEKVPTDIDNGIDFNGQTEKDGNN